MRRTPLDERLYRPAVMGVVNVTPDSFSDGGLHLDPGSAVATARRAIEEGAAIVDIGGESTRPGADAVPLDEELRRVLPVIEEAVHLSGKRALDRRAMVAFVRLRRELAAQSA